MLATTLLTGWILSLVPITPEEFHKLHAELSPAGPEKWQTIPWKVDLLAARSLAQETGKPLFLWSMNGHPLGCT